MDSETPPVSYGTQADKMKHVSDMPSVNLQVRREGFIGVPPRIELGRVVDDGTRIRTDAGNEKKAGIR